MTSRAWSERSKHGRKLRTRTECLAYNTPLPFDFESTIRDFSERAMFPQKRHEKDEGSRAGRSAPDPEGAREKRHDPPGRGPKGRRPQGHRGHSPDSIQLARVAGNDFELVHPRKVREVDLDYQEGLEIWKAGDPEAARDALRFALSACHANLWVHVALGQIALGDFHDPTLARGHFGYAVELAEHALPRGFSGRLPRDRPSNRAFYEAMEGLVECYEALGRAREAGKLRALADRLSRGCEGGGPAT